jgi:5-methylcytosine-specific restriction enzyme subunit McrC
MITLREQTQLSDEYIEQLDLRETYTSMPVEQLALNRGDDGFWWSSYYIGLSEINGQHIEVLPKLENLDFMSLFSFALLYQPSSEYFSSCYDINWENEIFASTELYNILTPLLVMQYLNILDKLVGKGLKRDYITIEDNLHSKIRGKLRPISNWRKNELKKKEDYFYCQYQVFSANIPVNRLLKKALDISLLLLGNVRSRSSNMTGLAFLSSKMKLIEAFRDIDSNIRLESVRNYKFDKLNMYYSEAIKLANCIIRHQDNALTDGSGKKKVPLFWIDMSRLYEVYVLGILQTHYPDKILFQVKGSYGTQCDYLHIGEGIVLDAKYKLWYSSYNGRRSHVDSMIADIREISAYARDEHFLSLMKNDVTTPICIIIHPDEETTNLGTVLSDSVKNNKVEGYKDFYRLSIDLPRL